MSCHIFTLYLKALLEIPSSLPLHFSTKSLYFVQSTKAVSYYEPVALDSSCFIDVDSNFCRWLRNQDGPAGIVT